MNAVFALIAIGSLMAVGAIVAFVWAVNDGQMDDMRGPAERAVYEDPVSASSMAGVSSKSRVP